MRIDTVVFNGLNDLDNGDGCVSVRDGSLCHVTQRIENAYGKMRFNYCNTMKAYQNHKYMFVNRKYVKNRLSILSRNSSAILFILSLL